VGWDLDEGLLVLGRRIVRQLELQRRVELNAGDVLDLDSWGAGEATAVVCQALLVHVPHAEQFLTDLVAALPAGARVGVVETDAVRVARRVRDSVTDRDPEYGALREQVAAALTAGGLRTLGVDLGLGRDLDALLETSGLQEVQGMPLGEGIRLPMASSPTSPRARWFAARLQRRLDHRDDPVERSLVEAGGLEPSRYEHWTSIRGDADRRRLQALRRGRYAREEGWTARAAWGIKGG